MPERSAIGGQVRDLKKKCFFFFGFLHHCLAESAKILRKKKNTLKLWTWPVWRILSSKH